MFDYVENRKFKLALLSAVIVAAGVFLNELGLDISVEELLAIVTPLLSFIGVEGVADVVGRYRVKADFEEQYAQEEKEEA